MSPAARPRNDELVEIRIVLEAVEPPVGTLRVVRGTGRLHDPAREVIGFSGWLGLLRALYELTTQPGQQPSPTP